MFKLRFRLKGRQKVKYLGCDAKRAAEIQVELDELQQSRNYDRRLRALARSASEQLREAKQRLEPLLEGTGWKLHGRAVRRTRRKKPSDDVTN